MTVGPTFSLIFALISLGPKEDAAQLYEQGVASYETHDFDSAIDAFTAAFSNAREIESEESRARALARLRFNLARAHVAKFDVDADQEHLKVARRLVNDYRGAARQEGRDPDEDTDVQDIEKELALREARIPPPASDDPTRDGPGDLEQNDQGADKSGRKLQVAGYTSLGFALPLVALGVAGTVLGEKSERDYSDAQDDGARTRADERGAQSNTLAYVGYVGAGVLAITGAVLVGVAAKKKRRSASRVRVGGLVYRQGAQLSIRGQF